MRWLSLSFGLLLCVGCSAELDIKEEAEELISSTFERWTGQRPTRVKCPERVKRKQGSGFQCTAGFGQTGAANAVVGLVQTNGRGGLAIASVHGLVFAADLEGRIARRFSIRLNTKLEVDCGQRVRPAVVGGEFFCTAKNAKGESSTLLVTMTDDKGTVSFGTELSPAP